MKPPADTGGTDLAPPLQASDYMVLLKPRIALFVALSTAVGFAMGCTGRLDLLRLLLTSLATFLIAGGSAALNQFVERDRDARMQRTAGRPLPAGRLQPERAYLFGLLLLAAGVLYLGIGVNWLTSSMAILTCLIYLFLYTPLKQKTVHSTVAGAVAGALPPVGGWAAAQGEVGRGAWVLFAILFLWQFPHFLSIFWLYREDYARGSYRMLPVEDPRGDRTSQQAVLYSLALLPFSLLPVLMGVAGVVYFLVALLLGVGLLSFSLAFARFRTDRTAKRLLRATLAYLPILWLVMILDKRSL